MPTISSDAEKVLSGAPLGAKEWILTQKFGNKLSSGEAKSLLNKWIAADAEKKKKGEEQKTALNGMLPGNYANLLVYNLPDEAFKTLVPALVPGTPEYQAAMDKLGTSYFDILQQQMNASNEQEQQQAQYNWQNLKKTIEDNLNISLSNNAFEAWDQVQSLKNQAGNQNIAGSGIQNESIDSYLNKVRRNDSITRNEAQSKEDSTKMEYYTKFATPEQVKQLVDMNPDLARSWGLIPSDEVKNSMSREALRAKYPKMSEEEIDANIASILDENGNYRSNLYQKYMTGSNVGVNMGNPDTANFVYDAYGNPIAKPVKASDTGILDIEQAKAQYQQLNTPLASQSENFKKLVGLGAIQPTVGSSSSGGQDTTLFNAYDPAAVTATNAFTTDPTLSTSSKSSSSSSGSSSSGLNYSNRPKGMSKREYEAKQSGGKLNYKTGKITLPGSL